MELWRPTSSMSGAAGAATAAGDDLSDRLVAALDEGAIDKLLGADYRKAPSEVLKEFKWYDATGQRYNNAQKKKAAERWKNVVAPLFKEAHGTDTGGAPAAAKEITNWASARLRAAAHRRRAQMDDHEPEEEEEEEEEPEEEPAGDGSPGAGEALINIPQDWHERGFLVEKKGEGSAAVRMITFANEISFSGQRHYTRKYNFTARIPPGVADGEACSVIVRIDAPPVEGMEAWKVFPRSRRCAAPGCEGCEGCENGALNGCALRDGALSGDISFGALALAVLLHFKDKAVFPAAMLAEPERKIQPLS